jgi:cell division protein FtsB
MPIVKFVQELAAENEQLKSNNTQLATEVEYLKSEILKTNAAHQLMSQRLEKIEALLGNQ